MTPLELRELRRELGWSQEGAARRLGLGLRGYRYNESGVTSRGLPIDAVPQSIAVAMLAFKLARNKTAFADFLAALTAEAGALDPPD